MNWTDANSKGCQTVDSRAHLAAITYDNKAFLSKQEAIFVTGSYYWVGLRSGDAEWNKDAEFATPVNYTNWQRLKFTEPDGSEARDNDCVLVTGSLVPSEFRPPGSWMDWDCQDRGNYLCELDQVRWMMLMSMT